MLNIAFLAQAADARCLLRWQPPDKSSLPCDMMQQPEVHLASHTSAMEIMQILAKLQIADVNNYAAVAAETQKSIQFMTFDMLSP